MIYVTFQYKAIDGVIFRYAVECVDRHQADVVADYLIGIPQIGFVRQSKPNSSIIRRIILTPQELRRNFLKE